MSEELKDKDIVKKEIADFLKIRDKEGNTLLHYVNKSNNIELANQLIAAGCDVNARNKYGDSSLFIPVHNNQREEDIVKKNIADFLKIRDREGNSLLHYVVKSDKVDFAKNLLAAGCDVNAQNEIQITPLIEAITENQLKMVEILLNAGADFQNDHYMWKEGPLYYAVMYGYPDIVQLLVDRGADVNARYKDRETPLHVATECSDEFSVNKRRDGYYKVIKILLDASANPNAIDESYRTPILNAVRCGFTEGFDLLLSRGANVCIGGEFDFRILFGAVQSRNLHILTRLVELGYDVNMPDDIMGENCLHEAAKLYSSEMMEFLLSKGAAINFITGGENALCYALDYWMENYKKLNKTSDDHDQEIAEGKNRKIYLKQMKCFNLFIKYGADLNHDTNDGETPLYIVLRNYKCTHSNFVRILLKNGATLDFDHPSVPYLFQKSKKSKFPRLLLRHAAMFETQKNSNLNNRPINFDLNKLNEKWRREYASCRDELELMKETKIEDTNVPFINILVNHDIGPYTRNERVRSAFETLSIVSKHFPIYGDLLYERFTEAVESEKLVKEATDGLGYVLNWDSNTEHLVLGDILRYLDKQDLMNLAKI